jgi:hypothetical protein
LFFWWFFTHSPWLSLIPVFSFPSVPIPHPEGAFRIVTHPLCMLLS